MLRGNLRAASAKALGLINWLEIVKQDPGKHNYASAGNGASGHMAMELLKTTAGLAINHIPYKGGSPAFNDVIAGQVPFMFINQDLPLAHLQAG